MATSRREFLRLAGGVCLPASDRVDRGGAGRVVFCRVSASSLPEAVDWLRSVFGGAVPASATGTTLRYTSFVASYRRSREPELVICGSEATLVLDRRGCRRFA